MSASTPSVTHRATRGCKAFDLAFVSGSTGAVPASFQRGRGVKSVSRLAAGKYKIFIERAGADIVGFESWVEQASFALTGACRGHIVDNHVADAVPYFTIQIVSGQSTNTDSGTTMGGPKAVDPTTGDVVKVKFEVKYSAGLA